MSLSIETPSFVSVVLIPYTPTAASPHHHSHLVALFTVSDTCVVTLDVARVAVRAAISAADWISASFALLLDCCCLCCCIGVDPSAPCGGLFDERKGSLGTLDETSLLNRSVADCTVLAAPSLSRSPPLLAASLADCFALSPIRLMERWASHAYRSVAALASTLAFWADLCMSLVALSVALLALAAADSAASDAVLDADDAKESRSRPTFDDSDGAPVDGDGVALPLPPSYFDARALVWPPRRPIAPDVGGGRGQAPTTALRVLGRRTMPCILRME